MGLATGRRRAGHRDEMGFLLATQLALAAGAGAVVERLQVALHKALAGPFHCGHADIQARGNLFIRQPLICLEQDASTGQFPGPVLTPLHELLKRGRFSAVRSTTYFFFGIAAVTPWWYWLPTLPQAALPLKTTQTEY